MGNNGSFNNPGLSSVEITRKHTTSVTSTQGSLRDNLCGLKRGRLPELTSCEEAPSRRKDCNCTPEKRLKTDIKSSPSKGESHDEKELPVPPEEEEEECCICLEVYTGINDKSFLPCSHSFHKNCIDPWLENHNTCPICRAEQKTNETCER